MPTLTPADLDLFDSVFGAPAMHFGGSAGLDEHWITTHSGVHLLIDDDGNVVHPGSRAPEPPSGGSERLHRADVEHHLKEGGLGPAASAHLVNAHENGDLHFTSPSEVLAAAHHVKAHARGAGLSYTEAAEEYANAKGSIDLHARASAQTPGATGFVRHGISSGGSGAGMSTSGQSQVAAAKAAATQNAGLPPQLPTLRGSFKQVSWAISLRSRLLGGTGLLETEAHDGLRRFPHPPFFNQYLDKFEEEMEADAKSRGANDPALAAKTERLRVERQAAQSLGKEIHDWISQKDDASWWIDNRADYGKKIGEEFGMKYRAAVLAATQSALLAAGRPAISPQGTPVAPIAPAGPAPAPKPKPTRAPKATPAPLVPSQLQAGLRGKGWTARSAPPAPPLTGPAGAHDPSIQKIGHLGLLNSANIFGFDDRSAIHLANEWAAGRVPIDDQTLTHNLKVMHTALANVKAKSGIVPDHLGIMERFVEALDPANGNDPMKVGEFAVRSALGPNLQALAFTPTTVAQQSRGPVPQAPAPSWATGVVLPGNGPGQSTVYAPHTQPAPAPVPPPAPKPPRTIRAKAGVAVPSAAPSVGAAGGKGGITLPPGIPTVAATHNGKPVLLVTMGLQGAGKSTILEHATNGRAGFQTVDADEIKKTLPGYDPKNPSLVHQQSVDESYRQAARHMKKGQPFIWDLTGVNPRLPGALDDAKKAGFHVHVLHVDTSLATALARNAARQRNVPAYAIHNVHSMIPGAKRALAQVAHQMTTVNND